MNFERRIHPLTMVVGLVHTIQRFIFLIGVLIFNRVSRMGDPGAEQNNVFEFMVLGFGALSVVGLFVNYMVTRFGVENNQFYLRSGWLQKKDRRIPLDRIQSVDIQRDLIPRLLGLSAIKIDTGAHEHGSEVRLQYVSAEDADEIVRRLSKGTSNTTGVEFQPPSEARPIWKTSLQELLTAGATENRALVMSFAALGFIWESERFGIKGQAILEKVFGNFDPAKATQQTWVAGGLMAFAVLIVGWIVSMGSTVIKWYGFKIVSDQGKLIRSFGLLNEHRTTLVVRRVQTVELRSSLIRRLIGLWEVHVQTAGQKLGEEKDGEGRHAVTGAFVPIVDREELPICINMLLPGFDLARLRFEKTSSKMALRVAIASAWFWLAVAGGVVASFGPKYAWTFAVAILLSGLLGFWRSRVCSYGRVRDVFVARDGMSMLRTGLIPDSKLQSVTLRSDPIDRLFGLVSIGFTTAGMKGHVSCLDKEKGYALYEDLCTRMNASGDWHPDGV